jgi:hypothetical protein
MLKKYTTGLSPEFGERAENLAMKSSKSLLFEKMLSPREKDLLNGLKTPAEIQAFLDQIPYAAGERNRSPLEVLRERQAHCLDGGCLAAAILRGLGYPPLIIDLQPDPGQDDDHVLVLYQTDGCWGAVAQSNYTGLRYREAIHRTLRELVLSYFEDFFNVFGKKTLRFYTRPVNLSIFDDLDWMTGPSGVDAVEKYLKKVRLYRLLTPAQEKRLVDVDRLSFEAGRIGLNEEGVFVPK